MKLNKNGYVMIYAIGVISLLMFLAASLTQVTMTRSNWANKQVVQIREATEAKMEVEAAAYEIRDYLKFYVNDTYKYLYQLNEDFKLKIFSTVQSKYDVTINELSIYSCSDTGEEPCDEVNGQENHSYTYSYEIVHEGKNVVAKKQFFVSMIPSYLYFGLGSKTDMTINGGAFIDGDIFINNRLYMSDTTNYVNETNLYNEKTYFATMTQNSKIYFSSSNYNIASCQQILPNLCYNLDNNKFTKTTFSPVTNIRNTFHASAPVVMPYDNRFLDVDFDASYVYYLNDAVFTDDTWLSLPDSEKVTIDRAFPITDQIDTIKTRLRDLLNDNMTSNIGGIKNFENPAIHSSVLFDNDLTISSKDIEDDLIFQKYTDPNNNETYYKFEYDKEAWIIVLGDLTIQNYDNSINPILINANFLVTGDITVTGNVQFNSTTYALGQGIIHNANINFVDSNDTNEINMFKDNQLVLLTYKNLQFSKINEFNNSFSGVEIDPFNNNNITYRPNIRGFFYTNSNVQVYTVSSYLVIEGGIYSNDANNLVRDEDGNLSIVENEKIIISSNEEGVTPIETDSIGLLINSYRGRVVNKPTEDKPFQFSSRDGMGYARFVVKYSPKVIQTQPKGLPLNVQLNYLFEDTTVRRK